MKKKDFNNKNRINNSKKMDFDHVVLQHKKEYMVKKWRKRIYKGGIKSFYNSHYIRFFIEEKKKLFPAVFKNSYYRTNKAQNFFEPHVLNYCRYYRLYKRYKKLKLIKLSFIRFRFRERVTYDYWAIKYFKVNKEYEPRKYGRDMRKKFYWNKKILTPFKYLLFLRYQELISLGKNPFTETSYYTMENSKMSLDFHRFFLNQYNQYLFIKNNQNLNNNFITLQNYLESDQYIHDILYTMPGVRWNEDKIIDALDEGFFELKNTNSNLKNYLHSDFLEIEYVNDLNREDAIVNSRIYGTFGDIHHHLEHANTKLYMNPKLTDLEEKAPMWKAIMRVWFGYEKVTFFRLHDDYYFFTIKYYYLWLPLLLSPVFPTSKEAPKRLLKFYKPWAKNPRYEPYIGTLFLPFQKKNYEKDVIKKKKRLKLSIFTKFIVFSFFIYILFL